MKIRPLFQNRRTHLGAVLTTTAALLLLGSVNPAFAKPGGNGGGKPGGEDPPPDPEPDPAPVSYVLTWLPDNANGSTVWDIDADGVAIGNLVPDGIFEDRFGVVSFPNRPELIDLEALASGHPDYPTGWRLTTAFTISDGLLISGDLYDPAGREGRGERHCFAMQLVDKGPALDPGISWFRVFSASDVGGSPVAGAVLYDASEHGDLSILTHVENPDGSESGSPYVWRPADGAPSATSVVGPSGAHGAINNSRDLLWGGRDPQVINADTGAKTLLGNYNGGLTLAKDISDNGVVVGEGPGGKKRGQTLSQAVRYIDGGWEAIAGAGTSSEAVKINSADQILGFSGSRLFLYSDGPAVGFRLIDDLLDPVLNSVSDLTTWDSAAALETSNPWLYSISDPDASGYGHICGRRTINGLDRGFILTPVAK